MSDSARGLFNKDNKDAGLSKRDLIKQELAQKKAAKTEGGAAVSMGGGGAPAVSATYVVLEKRPVGVSGKNQMLIKAVLVDTKSNGDQAAVGFGSFGTLLLPTEKKDPGPESKADSNNNPAVYDLLLSPRPPKQDSAPSLYGGDMPFSEQTSFPDEAKADLICAADLTGNIAYTAFPEPPKPRADAKPPLDLSALTVGTTLTAGACRASFGKSGDSSSKLYLNMHQVQVVGEVCPLMLSAQKIIAASKLPQVQGRSVSSLSLMCGGFFFPETTEQSQIEQALLISGDLDSAVKMVARDVRSKASLPSITATQQTQLLRRADALEYMTGKDLVAGKQPLVSTIPKDCTSSFSAMLLCSPVPGTSVFTDDAIDGKPTPARFVEGDIVSCESPSPALLKVAFSLTFVADTDKMTAAISSGGNPFLSSPGEASVAVQFLLRREAFMLLGCDAKKKSRIFEEVLKGATFAVSVSVFPSHETNRHLATPFVDTSGVDARAGIRGAGFPISSAFVDEHLMGKRGFFPGKGNQEDEVFEPMVGVSKRNFPKYSKDKVGAGYQCINWEQSLELSEIEEGATAWVLYPGCAKARHALGSLNNKEGEDYLTANYASLSSSGAKSMKDFLMNDALVYLVAPDPAP